MLRHFTVPRDFAALRRFPWCRPGPALAVAFAVGAAAGGFISPGVASTLLAPPLLRWAAAVLVLAAHVLAVSRAGSPRRRAAATALLALVLGALRAGGGDEPGPSGISEGPVRVEAWVAEVPVTVRAPFPASAAARSSTVFRTLDPALQVTVEGEVKGLRAGQVVLLEGRLLPAAAIGGTGGPRIGGGGRWLPPRFRVEDPRAARPLAYDPLRHPVAGLTLALRERAHRALEAAYPADQSGFLIALLLGDRRLLPDDYRRRMARTGTIHFLAVSGLNVGMAMAVIIRLPLPRRARLPARLGFLLVFTLVTGAAPPVVRAAVMLALHLIGEACGRAPRPLDTLGWAALIILAVEPSWTFDAGFWLSVAAVYALIAWAPALAGEGRGLEAALRRAARQDKADRSPAAGLIAGAARPARRALATAIATSAGTSHLVLLFFDRLHPLGPLWNLLIGPVVNAVLLGAALTAGLGAVLPLLSVPASWPTGLLCNFLLEALAVMERVPGSCIYLPPPPLWAALAAQTCLVAGAPGGHRRCAVALALLTAAGLFVTESRMPEAEVAAVDGGRGGSVLLRVRGAGSYLFDAGGGRRGSGERIARALLRRGVRRLDGVFLSHPHDDHVGGLLEMAEVVRPARVWVSPLFERFPLGARLAAELSALGVPVERVGRGQRIESGGRLRLDVLHPAAGESLTLARSANEGSLVVKAELGGTSLLFPGDIEEEGTARLLSAPEDLSSAVLLLPHHGRENRLLSELLARARPQVVIVHGASRSGREECARLRGRGLQVLPAWETGQAVLRLDSGRWLPSP